MKWTYLVLDLISISFPLLYSFHTKMKLIQWWKYIFIAISLTAFLFISWDIFFTKHHVWGFNSDYILGIYFLHLPLEEWLFFWMIPYASLFIYFSLQYFKPDWKFSNFWVKILFFSLITFSIIILITSYAKIYTALNFSVLLLILSYTYSQKKYLLNRFFLAYIIVLIPFIFVNGYLTGMFTKEPIVWYNNSENTGIRFITIPIEDFAYAFSMLLLSLVFIEKQVKISWNNDVKYSIDK